MKRILIFSVAYHPFVGGAEVAVKEITDRISDIAFDMITLNLDGKQQSVEKRGNVTVYRLGGPGIISKLLFPFKASRLALKLNETNSYNASWSIMASWAGIAAAFFKKKQPDIPLILTVQEGDEEAYLMRYVLGSSFLYKIFIQPWHKLVFERADITTAISSYLAERAKKSGSRGDVNVIPNGVDIALFSKEPSRILVDQVREAIHKKPGGTVLITTSRLVEKNGVGDVIKALPLLPPSVLFVILGTGPLKVQLKKLAYDLHVDNQVAFMGFVEYKGIPAYLAASDIFIRPSLSEGMGNSFIEAMAARIPVIATPVGGIPDFLHNGVTGLMCEPRNPQSIAEKIQTLIENKNLRTQLIANAHTLALEKYDWNIIAERMKTEIFAKVLV